MKKLILFLLLAIGTAAYSQAPEPAIYAFDMRSVKISPDGIDTLDVRMVMALRADSVCFDIDRPFCFTIKFMEKSPGSTLIVCENEFGEPAGVRLLQSQDKFLVWIMQHPPSPSYFLTSKIP